MRATMLKAPAGSAEQYRAYRYRHGRTAVFGSQDALDLVRAAH